MTHIEEIKEINRKINDLRAHYAIIAGLLTVIFALGMAFLVFKMGVGACQE